MSNPPPPYSDITGISRSVMKDNAQETVVNYDGNARPGELTMDLTTDPPTVYIGNNLGNLTQLTFGGSGNGVPGGPTNSVQINNGAGGFAGYSNFTFNGTNAVTVIGNVNSTNVYASSNIVAVGNVTASYGIFSGGNTVINSVISTTGNIIGGNISASGNIIGGNISTTGNVYAGNIIGNTTFNGGYYGAFHSDQSTTLTNTINSNTTSPIVVDSTAGFYSSGWLIIDAEVVAYTGKTSTSFTGITRGVAGTNGATHTGGAPISSAQVTPTGVTANVRMDITDLSNGVTLDSSTGIITCANAGLYNFQFSIQVACAGNAPDNIVLWYVYNGNAIPATGSYATIPAIHAGVPGSNIITVNIFYLMNAGDTMQIQWTTIGGSSFITSYPPSYVVAGAPASPGVILTVNQVG